MPAVPWQEVSLDFLTSLPTLEGNSTLLVVVDRFSKMMVLVPLRETTNAESVAHAFFSHVVRVHGLPRRIISDRDPRFVGDVWTRLMAAMGTRLAFSTAYHP